MATYSVQAIHSVERVQGSTAVVLSIQTTNILLTVEDDTTAIEYSISDSFAAADIVEWSNSDYLTIQASGRNSITAVDAPSFIFSGQSGLGTNTLVVLQAAVENDDTFQSFIFNLAGPSLPFFTSQTQVDAYINSMTGLTSNLSPDPGPGNSISLGTANISLATDDDVFVFDGGTQWHNVGRGNDSIDGGGGVDMLSFVSMTSGMTIDMDAGTATGSGVAHSLQNFEGITGSVRADYIVGDAGDNRLRGLGDYDWFIASEGADRYDGGTGRDMVSYIESTERVVVTLYSAEKTQKGLAFGDTYKSIERVTGSSFNDVFWGSDGADDFRGMGGYDTFYGSAGGKDRYYGGSGIDTVNYSETTDYELTTEGVIASLWLGRGSGGIADRDLYFDIENLTGTEHDDILTGDNGRNKLYGEGGDDILYGEGGDDILYGNGGVDYLYGRDGLNTLDGGAGWDYAFYDFEREFYTINTDAMTGVTTVAFNDPTERYADTLTNVEVLQFADGDVIL